MFLRGIVAFGRFENQEVNVTTEEINAQSLRERFYGQIAVTAETSLFSAELLDWESLSEERKQVWIARTKEGWNGHH